MRRGADCPAVDAYRQALHAEAVATGMQTAEPEEPRGEDAGAGAAEADGDGHAARRAAGLPGGVRQLGHLRGQLAEPVGTRPSRAGRGGAARRPLAVARAPGPARGVRYTRSRRRDWRCQVDHHRGATAQPAAARLGTVHPRPAETPALNATSTPLRDPRGPQARRRPLRLRPVEGPPRAARPPRAGRAPRSWAPRTARSPSRRSSAACARACAELFALPDGYEVALGNGGTTAFWDAAALGPRPRAARCTSPSASSRRSSPTVTTGRAVPRATRSSVAPTRATRPRPPATRTPTSSPGPTTRPRPA